MSNSVILNKYIWKRPGTVKMDVILERVQTSGSGTTLKDISEVVAVLPDDKEHAVTVREIRNATGLSSRKIVSVVWTLTKAHAAYCFKRNERMCL